MSLTFSLDDLLVFGVIGAQEGYGLAGVQGLLEAVVDPPPVVTLLH